VSEPTTREQILDAAEELVAEEGIEGATLRAITGRAGANLAAVNYHFGSKDGLMHEVMLRHIHPVNQERLRRLEELAPGATLEEVLDAFLRPVFEMVAAHEGRWSIIHRVMGRMLADAERLMPVFQEEFAPLVERTMTLLGRRLPGLDPATLFYRVNFMAGGMIHFMRVGHLLGAMSGGACDGTDRVRALDEMIRFTAAGLRAPGGTS